MAGEGTKVEEDAQGLTDEDLSLGLGVRGGIDVDELLPQLETISQKLTSGEPSARSSHARDYAGGRLEVRQAVKTFEYELAAMASNHDVMLSALQLIHPGVEQDLRSAFSDPRLTTEQKAICIWLVVRDAKAEYAQRLAGFLEERGERDGWQYTFNVPTYIAEAIQLVAPVSSADSGTQTMEDDQ